MLVVLELSHCLVKDRMTGKKFMKITKEKTDELQKGIRDDERFDRE